MNAHCGGCRARAYGMTGDLMAEDPLCTHTPGKFVGTPLRAIRARRRARPPERSGGMGPRERGRCPRSPPLLSEYPASYDDPGALPDEEVL